MIAFTGFVGAGNPWAFKPLGRLFSFRVVAVTFFAFVKAPIFYFLVR